MDRCTLMHLWSPLTNEAILLVAKMVQSYPKLTQDLKNMSQLLAANLLPTYWLLADYLLTDLLNHLLTLLQFQRAWLSVLNEVLNICYRHIRFFPIIACKITKIFWRGQILEKESDEKMKIEKEITQNSYFDRCEVRF